jgi:hypothetical protein
MTRLLQEPAPIALPRIDLVRANLEHFCFACFLDEAESFNDLLELESDLWDDDVEDVPGFASLTKYKRSSAAHLIAESVYRDEDEGKLAVRIAYDVETKDHPLPSGRVPKLLRHEGAVLSRLTEIGSPMVFHCHAQFLFLAPEGGPSVPTAFALPLRPSGDESEAVFDEIRGVRGVKFHSEQRGKYLYTFILDRPENREVLLTIRFVVEGIASVNTPRTLMDVASDFARRIVPLDEKGTKA